MSGMYNIVFGYHPHLPIVAALLGKEKIVGDYFGRFRDAWIEKLPDDTMRIHVYTRNGGNNRAEYMPDLSKDPLFIENRDDSFDNTYASIYLKLPEDWQEKLKEAGAPDDFKLEAVAEEPIDTGARWQEALEAMRG